MSEGELAIINGAARSGRRAVWKWLQSWMEFEERNPERVATTSWYRLRDIVDMKLQEIEERERRE